MTPLRVELDLESVVALHVALGKEEGLLVPLKKKLLDYLYEHLSIEDLEEIERLGTGDRGTGLDRHYDDKKGRR